MNNTALSPEEFQAAVQNLMEISDNLVGLPALPLSELDPEASIVFSVDMNNGFAKHGDMSSERVGAIIPATAQFINRCIEAGCKVIGFTDAHTPDSLELKAFPAHCLIDDAQSSLVDELCAIERVYPKNSTNAFFAGGQGLVSSSVKHYIVTGCCTDICIYQFAISLKAYLNHQNIEGDVIVPLSLVETYDAPGHSAALFSLVFTQSMIQNGIKVVTEII